MMFDHGRSNDIQKLHRSLTNHPPTEEQIKQIEDMRFLAKELGEKIINNTPHGKERMLAIAKLEDSVMWAVKGIVLEELNE